MELSRIQSGTSARPQPDVTERGRGGDIAGNGLGEGSGAELLRMPMFARWRVVLLLALLVGLLSPASAAAASPTETMEGFFDRANAILLGADRARGIEEPRLAIASSSTR
jgi:hypothetical protein